MAVCAAENQSTYRVGFRYTPGLALAALSNGLDHRGAADASVVQAARLPDYPLLAFPSKRPRFSVAAGSLVCTGRALRVSRAALYKKSL